MKDKSKQQQQLESLLTQLHEVYDQIKINAKNNNRSVAQEIYNLIELYMAKLLKRDKFDK
ncbi:MAG: hypothetical protein ORN24_07210 [Burkholderiales bacterium]|nr:hypothetical protein [Burkholderiales bacterium]